MNRDGIKTIIGLLVIGLIIVATFLYGNHQRQAQLRHDEDLKRQQTASQTAPQATTTPVMSKTSPQASVPSSTPNPIQGQGNAVTVPQTGGSALSTTTTTTPRTGADAMVPIALLALIISGVYYVRSRREVVFALVPSKRH